MINNIRRLFGFYDQYGLRYSTSHLKEIGNQIPFYTRAHQALYVDKVTRQYVNKWSAADLKIEPNRWFVTGYNTTGIGNMAYVSLYHKDEDVRKIYDEALNNLAKYLSIHNYDKV